MTSKECLDLNYIITLRGGLARDVIRFDEDSRDFCVHTFCRQCCVFASFWEVLKTCVCSWLDEMRGNRIFTEVSRARKLIRHNVNALIGWSDRSSHMPHTCVCGVRLFCANEPPDKHKHIRIYRTNNPRRIRRVDWVSRMLHTAECVTHFIYATSNRVEVILATSPPGVDSGFITRFNESRSARHIPPSGQLCLNGS